MVAAQLLRHTSADLPLAVANAFDYVPDWWYSPELRPRIIYLADPAYAVRQRDFLPELSLVAEQRFIPVPVARYSEFVRTHQHFLLLVSGLDRLLWLPSRLTNNGWRLTWIASDGAATLYRADRP